jgi:hypothetical protein
MRDLIIDAIRDSSKWRKCWECGEDMPLLESMPNKELLLTYNFFLFGQT